MRYIPVALVQKTFEMKIKREFRLYIYLNNRFPGYFRKEPQMMNEIRKDLEIKSPKTLRKLLLSLVELRFLGLHKKVYYIRSMRLLIKSSRYKVEFHEMYLSNFDAYMGGVLIGYLALQQRQKELSKRIKEGATRGYKMEPSYQRLPASFPVSIKSIKKIFKTEYTTAHQLRQLAFRKKFIHIEKSPKKIIGNVKTLGYEILKYSNNLFISKINGNIVSNSPDHIKPLLMYKKQGKGKKL